MSTYLADPVFGIAVGILLAAVAPRITLEAQRALFVAAWVLLWFSFARVEYVSELHPVPKTYCVLAFAAVTGIALEWLFRWNQPAVISISPRTLNVTSCEWTISQEVSVTNNLDTPRYQLSVTATPSHTNVDLILILTGPLRSPQRIKNSNGDVVEVDLGAVGFQYAEGCYVMQIQRIGPKETVILKLEARLSRVGASPAHIELEATSGESGPLLSGSEFVNWVPHGVPGRGT